MFLKWLIPQFLSWLRHLLAPGTPSPLLLTYPQIVDGEPSRVERAMAMMGKVAHLRPTLLEGLDGEKIGQYLVPMHVEIYVGSVRGGRFGKRACSIALGYIDSYTQSLPNYSMLGDDDCFEYVQRRCVDPEEMRLLIDLFWHGSRFEGKFEEAVMARIDDWIESCRDIQGLGQQLMRLENLQDLDAIMQ